MAKDRDAVQASWLGLSIGNSRCHWASFRGDTLQQSWDTGHLQNQQDRQHQLHAASGLFTETGVEHPELWLASVVAAQTRLWQDYPNLNLISLQNIPLQGVYSTLGVDRALSAWGANLIWNSATLVIDAGTALTYTGVDTEHRFVGGAILPGLGLQGRSLSTTIAALPPATWAEPLPSRWAVTTETAIQSGVVYTLLAGMVDFIQDWWQQFPNSAIVLTGGDGPLLVSYVKAWLWQKQYAPDWLSHLVLERELIFKAMILLRRLP